MVTAIVLAAGESRRMGRLKPLLAFGKGTVIEAVVRSLKACPVDEILVVTGHRSPEIAAALATWNVHLVENPDYRAGMLSSIQRGVQAADPQTDWLILALADQPHIPPAVVEQLLAEAGQELGVLIPTFEGRRGHPILIHASCREEIAALPPEGGLRQLWAQRPELVRHIPVASPAVLQDMDTPEDYARLAPREEPEEED